MTEFTEFQKGLMDEKVMILDGDLGPTHVKFNKETGEISHKIDDVAKILFGYDYADEDLQGDEYWRPQKIIDRLEWALGLLKKDYLFDNVRELHEPPRKEKANA